MQDQQKNADRERRSIWTIIIVLFFVGLFRFSGFAIGVSPWDLNRPGGGLGVGILGFLVGGIIMSPAACAMISSLVYGWLHYQRRHLTLWLMAMQMMILLLIAFYPFAYTILLLMAWVIMIAVIVRSKETETETNRTDILDDI